MVAELCTLSSKLDELLLEPGALKEPTILSTILQSADEGGDLDDILELCAKKLDAVEAEIVDEVTRNADSFLESLTELDQIDDQVSALSGSINELLSYLADIDTSYKASVRSLEGLSAELEALFLSQAKMSIVEDFLKGQAIIQDMLDAHSFSDALNLIRSKISSYNQHLADISILKPLANEVKEMEVALEKLTSDRDKI